tara:strand:+ start:192 stop:956 length:765 start_codon:yes stop_codon:yes gene_type:complete
MDLSERVYIVTGASSGIGAETAVMLAAKGARVAVSYGRNQSGAEETASRCQAAGGEALVIQGDVAADADCQRIAAETMAKWGRIDGLVNNAGTTKFIDHANLDGLSAEDFQHIYGVNVVGAFQMTRAAAPHLKAAGNAAVVNVSSVAGVYGVGSSIAYAASKGALNTMTISLARVLGPEIRVNAVCPGLVETGFWAGQIDAERKQAIADSYIRKAPLKRYSRPEETAQSILYFLTGDPNITGQLMISDGGINLA